MIMNDAWIAKQCVPPDTFFDKTLYDLHVKRSGIVAPAIEGGAEMAVRALRAQYTRPTTVEECLAFVPMIAPFNGELVRKVYGPAGFGEDQRLSERKIISKGLTSYGYDVSLAEEFKLFTNVNSAIVDPKRMDDRCLVDAKLHMDDDGAKFVILPPNSYLLGRTVEYFHMPRDVLAVCLGKSSYARAGAIVNVTPIEPGFEGHVVIEISNATNLPMKIYAGEGISQFVFFKGEPCKTSYADRGGKYMGQQGITLSKV